MTVYRNRFTGEWRLRCYSCDEVFDPPKFGLTEEGWSPHETKENIPRECISCRSKPCNPKRLDS